MGRRMQAAGFVATMGVGVVTYGASPYVALYHLDQALRRGDVAAVTAAVDWPSVRAGLKQQVDARMVPRAGASDDALPAFGASFMRGVASHVVDEEVTPQRLAHLLQPGPTGGQDGQQARLDWAFFNGPTSFSARLHLPGRSGDLDLTLALVNGGWKVVNVRLPQPAGA